MDRRAKLLAISLLVGAASGCSTAPIALSPQLSAANEALALAGMGHGEKGRFAIAQSSGEFTRRAAQFKSGASFPGDGFTRQYGGGTFSVSGPDFAGAMSATCRYSEVEHKEGSRTSTVERFRYRCVFARDGRPIDAELRLATVPRSPGKILSTATRAGELDIEGRAVAIEPIHHLAGTRLPSGDPLGYRFVSHGRDIGAVDLNGERKTVFAPRYGPDREAVLIGSLALSILWYG